MALISKQMKAIYLHEELGGGDDDDDTDAPPCHCHRDVRDGIDDGDDDHDCFLMMPKRPPSMAMMPWTWSYNDEKLLVQHVHPR